MHHFDETIPMQPILSGKLRRYHTLPLWRQLLRPVSIVLPNIRDSLLVFCGFIQSFFKLLVWRPDVVFTKGGYVCLPVGFAAKLLHIPLVIHDSDAHPGLTSRVLSRWATVIATGAPLEYYSYPKNISRYVGIPISDQFVPMDDRLRSRVKRDLGFDEKRPLIVITGGGLGAKRLNDVVARALPELLDISSLMLISGAGQYDELRATTPQGDNRYQLHDFISEGMASILGAADIVVTRAGATTILELAALAKPTILVPNAYLTAGHQLKNAAVYAEKDAAIVLDEKKLEDDPGLLVSSLAELLSNPAKKQKMADSIYAFAKPQAARDMADMIIGAVKRM
jgi:UDP-N-acetylglucosamine--N-acetylmuramyl-(pentapeptide) pyrophosphoryl-undecaprenol N-acetylglucosamine transferase